MNVSGLIGPPPGMKPNVSGPVSGYGATRFTSPFATSWPSTNRRAVAPSKVMAR